MPPGLISSAAPGKKAAAPKAAPRRRAAPPPSAAVVSSAPTNAAQPTPEPTQRQTQAPVGDPSVQHGDEARPRDSEVKTTAKDAPARPEIVAEKVSSAGAEIVERARESGPFDTALPTPEPTQTETAHQSGVEAERRDDGERQKQDEARLRLASEEAAREEAQRDERREVHRAATRHEELAVKARQAAEREEARRSEINASSDATSSSNNTTYVPPSASSATPATVDPTTLPPPPPRPDAAAKPNAKRPRAEKSGTAAPRPRKKAKTNSVRSNAKVQDVANGEAEVDGGDVVMTTETEGAKSKPKQKRKPAARKAVGGRSRQELSVSTIQNSDDETEGQHAQADLAAEAEAGQEVAVAAQPAPKKQRKPRTKRVIKKKTVKTTAQSTEGLAEGEDGTRDENSDVNEEENADASDPELHEIDPNSLSMWELSRDDHYGKKSERGKKMAEIDWDKVAQDRRDAANALVASFRTDAHLLPDTSDNVVTSVEGPSGTAEPEDSQGRRSHSRAATIVAAPTPAPAPINDDLGLGFVLDADGNIVADENTMTFTRDAAAQAAANPDAPIEEFNDLTHTVNRFTHINANRRDPADRLPLWKSKSDPWSEDETDKFYDALRMFGTDFFIISKMFAPKTRRMIKNKFNREEKFDPNRINRALTGIVETPMSLEHYSRETGFAMEKFTRYDGVEHAQTVIDSENAGKEVVDEKEVKRREKEAARLEKEKEKERDKEERKAKRKAKTKKGIAEAGGAGFGGGGPIEDVVGGAE